MDPIMKLLEDDEDESLHSGADVEAFTAALNREVEASASASASTSTSVPAGSSSQPTDHGAGLLPQEHKSLLNHDPGQWQDPVKNEIVNQESQQQEQTHAFRNDHPSRPEMVSQGSNNCPLPTNTPKECDLLKAKQEPGSTSQQGIVAQHQPMQQMKSEQTPIVSQQQSMQQMKNQQTPVTNQTNSATTTAKAPVVTFHMLIPILSRYLDKARDIEVQSIFAKLRKNEVSKEYFLKTVRNIVGDKLLKQAASQYQMQAQRSPQTNPSNYSLSGQVSGQQTAPSGSVTGDEQKGYPGAHTIPMRQAIASTRPPQFRPSSSGQMRSNTVNQALGSSKVSAGMESQSQQLSAPKPLAATSLSQTQSHGIQEEPKIQIQSSVQAPPAAASKTPQRKASSGQKKPLEVLGSSPPPSSKKQKVSGGFHEQSIDQLNDVTAVSGVNLREEEEHLFSAPKEEGRVSEVARKVVQLEEEKLILQKGPLTQKLAGIMSKCNLKVIGTDVERCLSMCVEERLRGFIRSIIRFSKQRVEVEKSRHHFYPLSSDVRSHIMRVNREAREQWEKKQAEDAERIRKQNDGDGNANVDLEKDRIETRGLSKHAKTYKEDDDKMRTTAANVAARVAAGGDDMLSKWQLLAERNKQRSEGGDGSSGSVPGNMLQHRPSLKSGKDLREEHEVEKRGYSTMLGSGGVRRSPLTKVARSISMKDVVAALEREPQMSKSSLLFRLYGRPLTEPSAK
ncbi:transcription initiation factor TFIID subunit 4b isoform X6 [Zea mays]|uniref:transcription initiation factor TFIID subunit 4b isoform X6 n=1 Tax=Zea mays TaxID=4577 RepID=UPI0009AAB791|nr:transcription initiation factor TFIID subunit 4b isoform X6 [Zea mays]|eukprot:XP_020402000.1 transcription initiation factor TFIID subunit 4b isoform X6 [Zea mays]